MDYFSICSSMFLFVHVCVLVGCCFFVFFQNNAEWEGENIYVGRGHSQLYL